MPRSVSISTCETESVWGAVASPRLTYTEMICPRTLRLLSVASPQLVGCFFTQLLPRYALLEPAPNDPDYWTEVHRILESVPPDLKIESRVFNHLYLTLLDTLPDNAKEFIVGREVYFFILCFLSPPPQQIKVPETNTPMKKDIGVIMAVVTAYVTVEKPLTGQHAFTTILFAYAQWEIRDRLG